MESKTISDILMQEQPDNLRFPIYELVLYIAGPTPQSIRAVANIKKICKERLQGKYSLDVIDLYQQPHLAKNEQIVAVPMVVKKSPPPSEYVIGDMSDADKVSALLGLISEE